MNNFEVELTSEQTEKILQFQDLTLIEDLSLCRDALQRHGWDLESAIQDQLNIREGRPSVFSSDNHPPIVVNDARSQHVYVPQLTTAQWPWRYGGPFGFAASLIFRMIYDTFSTVVKFVSRFIFPPPRFPLTDPIGDVLRHIRQFEENFGHEHPVFYQGIYSQALNDAKFELRFLLIHLHSENDQDSIKFCRETLVDPDVISFINGNNMLFWSCSINSGEGQRVANSLRVTASPFVGVIVVYETKMVLVARFQGNMGPRVFLTRLQDVTEIHVTSLIAARADRMERSINQSLRAQQDEAYMASLLADQEKHRKQVEEEQKKKNEELEKLQEIENAKQRLLDLKNKKKEAGSKVPPEPEYSSSVIRILFKMPNGARIERNFLKTHTMKDIYNFVFFQLELSSQFEVYTNFPKRILECTSDSTTTLVDAGLSSKEVLFIYDLES